MNRLASPVSGSRQGAFGFPFELRRVGQPRRQEVGHQLEDVSVGVVEVLRLAGHDPQHTEGLAGPEHRGDGDGAHAGPATGGSVHPGVRIGVPAQEGHADAHAETGKAGVCGGA